jgi:hypothetical protein
MKVAIVVGALMVTICVLAAREVARRNVCIHRLKGIAIAMHNYHETYKSFPPAYVPDANGKPMHSWRVLLLLLSEAA